VSPLARSTVHRPHDTHQHFRCSGPVTDFRWQQRRSVKLDPQNVSSLTFMYYTRFFAKVAVVRNCFSERSNVKRTTALCHVIFPTRWPQHLWLAMRTMTYTALQWPVLVVGRFRLNNSQTTKFFCWSAASWVSRIVCEAERGRYEGTLLDEVTKVVFFYGNRVLSSPNHLNRQQSGCNRVALSKHSACFAMYVHRYNVLSVKSVSSAAISK